MYVVTISAAYGAGGSVVGPRVAERLGVGFIDRAIPAAVAAELGVTIDDALAHDERAAGWLSRLLAAAAPLSTDYLIGSDAPRIALISDTQFVERTENAIHAAISERGGVILGRAAALVLRDHPTALHVRLDGDRDRRVRQAIDLLGLHHRDAEAALEQNDEARTAYVRHYYHADPSDPRHYHLLLDSTRLALDCCVEVITAAARCTANPPRSR